MIGFLDFLREAQDFDVSIAEPAKDEPKAYIILGLIKDRHLYPYKQNSKTIEVVFNLNDVVSKFDFKTDSLGHKAYTEHERPVLQDH